MGPFFSYFSLILAQVGIAGKQYSMKICGSRAPGKFNSVCINLMRAAICLVVSLIIWIVSGCAVTGFWGHLVIIFAGIGTALNLFTWVLASRMISLTLLECFMMLGSMVFPMIIGPTLYPGETVSVLQWIGCALIFGAVFLFVNKGSGKRQEGSFLQTVLTVFICVIGFSLSAILKKYYQYYFEAKGDGSVEYFAFINFVTVLLFFGIFFLIYYLRENRRLKESATADSPAQSVELPYKKVWFFIVIAAASLYLNEFFIVYAADLNSAVYYTLQKALSVLSSFLLDVFVFRDKVNIKKLIGLAVVIFAIVLVNL